MGDSNTKRNYAHLELSVRADDVMSGIKEETGISQKEGLTRIIEWFASLDPKLRLAVLHKNDATRDELLRLTLREMLGIDAMGDHIAGKPVTHDEGVRIVQKLMDQMHAQHLSATRELEDARKALRKRKSD